TCANRLFRSSPSRRRLGSLAGCDFLYNKCRIIPSSTGRHGAREELPMSKRVTWSGVFPAVTTQFRADLSVDVEATARVMARLVAEGVSGLVVCGTVGENCSLSRAERIEIMEAAHDASAGRVPVIAGIAEYTTPLAAEMAREAARAKVDGVMVMPALVY